MGDGFWGKEEFEDRVAKGLLALYEEGYAMQSNKFHRHAKVSRKELQRVRDFGLYFAPGDRLVDIKQIYPTVDGWPTKAVWAETIFNREDEVPGYLKFGYVEPVEDLPGDVRVIKRGRLYKVIWLLAQEQGGLVQMKHYVTIDHEGYVHPTRQRIRSWTSFGLVQEQWIVEDEMPDCTQTAAQAAVIINFFADRKYLWNVVAIEGRARAMFGVHAEQIKSLFYARDLPMSITGRKRPILHWVAAHRRRIQSGTDVDIKKHLRGVDRFEMNGTLFEIANPLKKGSIVGASQEESLSLAP